MEMNEPVITFATTSLDDLKDISPDMASAVLANCTTRVALSQSVEPSGEGMSAPIRAIEREYLDHGGKMSILDKGPSSSGWPFK